MALVAKAFQDIITFSRASSGTYVNSNGYITNSSVLNYLTYSNQPENAAWTKSNSFVQQNLLLYSQEFDNAAWSVSGLNAPTANAIIAPDGTLTADALTPNTATTVSKRIFQTISSITGAYTFSLYAKVGTYNLIQVYYGGTGTDYANFDLSTGTTGTVVGSATITSVGNGWYRLSHTITASAQVNVTVCFIDSTTAARASSSAATGTVYVWGAQLVQGSVPGDYRATTSAALPVLYADYNGALRARKLCEGNAAATQVALYETQTVIVGGVYTVSCRAKLGERRYFALYPQTLGVGGYAVFDLQAGVITATGGSQYAGSGMTSLGGGWYLCYVSYIATGTSSPVVTYFTNSSTVPAPGYTGDGSSGIYIADAQLNDGSSALAYYDTTASAYNAPRFDYDPVTLAAKGLLVEELRQNLLLRSNDWSATWNNTNITRTAAAALGPDGQMSMTKLEATASAATNSLQPVVATATSHTYSIYAKKGSGATDSNAFAVYNSTTATTLASITINYDTGVVTQTVGTGATATASGNNIWRIVIPVTSGITIGNTLNVYSCYLGGPETAGEFAYVYGAQLEAGAFATSYIPTVGSQVTRAGDFASVNTLSPWYNSVAGTLYVEATAFAGTGGNRYYEFTDGTSANVIQAFAASATINTEWIYVSGAPQAQLSSSGSPTSLTKIGAAYATNDFAASLNGAAPATDTSGSIPSVNKLILGGSAAGLAQLCGHLRRITYYPRRLTNAELQTLTTL